MSRALDDLRVRPMTPEDWPAALDVLRASMGNAAAGADFLRWKHEENPFGVSPGLVAEHDQKVVALRLFMRWRFRTGPEELSAVRAVDTATHPRFQGRGLFRTLTLALVEQMRKEGVAFVFNTPNEKSRPGYLKMGWSDVTRVPVWVRATRPLRAALRRAGALFPASPSFESLEEDRASLRALLQQPALPSFLEAARPRDSRYHTPRTPSFLRWRYADAPGLAYGARGRFDEESGAVVLYRRRARGGFIEGTVLDVACSRDLAGIRDAARLLRRLGRELDVDYLAATAAPRTREAAALALAGFVPLGARGPRFTSLPLNPKPARPNPVFPSSWRLSAGDLELF